jgi:hypothetical protein
MKPGGLILGLGQSVVNCDAAQAAASSYYEPSIN